MRSGGRKGSAQPQGGPRKVHRRAEEGAVGGEGRKKDGIKEWGLKESPWGLGKGPQGGPERDLKGVSRKLGKKPGTVPKGSPGGPRKETRGKGNLNQIMRALKKARGGPGKGCLGGPEKDLKGPLMKLGKEPQKGPRKGAAKRTQ
jgi:hypothetical protein